MYQFSDFGSSKSDDGSSSGDFGLQRFGYGIIGGLESFHLEFVRIDGECSRIGIILESRDIRGRVVEPGSELFA